MKKYSVLLLALLAVSAYGKKVESKGLSLNTLNDSVNYALGFVNGCQIQSYQLKDDASPSVRNEFIDALQRGYDGKVQVRNEAQNIGSNIGQAIQSFERNGLVEKAAWTLNEKLLFQGLVNGLLQDTTMMPIMVARQYFQTQYEADSIPAPAAKGAKLVLSKCGFTAASVELKSRIDSLNYAFGLINGSEIYANALAKDSTKQGVKDLISALNESLQSKYKNPQLVNQGEQIGQAIKQQETVGLLNIPQLATNFALIKQGFLDGMNQKTALFTSATAGQYLQVTIPNIQYGDNKAAGEQFLAENKLKEGVITTASGLQYKVITMGNGAKPTATDKVKVHYHGTLIDGTVFDSSVERGEPISFGLDQVIAGWTEGVQLMPVGSKFIFYIPQELAYGERAAGSIKPYSTLIFEVELLDIEQ